MLQNEQPRIVLASGSVTRHALLSAAGLAFDVEPAAVDEDAVRVSAQAEQAGAEDAAVLLAELKAVRVSQRRRDALVIGADQILVCENRWFSKPSDLPDARAQLLALRGRTHRLATAVVCCIAGQRVWHHVARPSLTMRAFSDAFLDDYLAREGDAARNSVGCYRLEGLGIHLFSRTQGNHTDILGLPMIPLLGFLRQRGILIE